MGFLLVNLSDQLQLSETKSLLKIQELLNNPSALSSLNNNRDFCDIEPTSSFTLVCYEGAITQLHIIGNNGFPSLPQNFSIHSFFSALVEFSSLKVLSLVSLGLWGPMPGNVGHLSSLEILNVSSNYFSGDIPLEILFLRNLQTLVLDHNNFTGQVPFWLNSLPLLTVLSFKHNLLSGSLPNSLGTLQNLRVLTLSENYLSGQVPDLSKLRNLQVLDLEGNKFGPHFPGLPRKLVTFVLRNNKFREGIPEELGSFYLLQKLDISLNGFVGPFSPSLLSLPSIRYLDISGNKFTGVLLQNMSCNADLAFVNLTSNYLVGKLPSCLVSGSKESMVVAMYSGNCLSNDDAKQHPAEFCHKEALAVEVMPRREKLKVPSNSKPVVALSVGGGIFGVVAIIGLVSLFVKRIYGKDNVKKTSTRLITENASTVNTAKMLSNASKFYHFLLVRPQILFLFSLGDNIYVSINLANFRVIPDFIRILVNYTRKKRGITLT